MLTILDYSFGESSAIFASIWVLLQPHNKCEYCQLHACAQEGRQTLWGFVDRGTLFFQ